MQETTSSDLYDIIECLLKYHSVEKLRILNTRFNIELNKVEVRPTLISNYVKENGVFAKRNIMEDELLTLYPGDIIECHDAFIYGSHLKNKFIRSVKLDPYCLNDYSIVFNSSYNIIGNPNLIEDPAYIGHICNDGVINPCSKSKQIYEEESAEKGNAKFVRIKNCHLALVSTRNINEDDEIFVKYGYSYWDK
jgi:hypothetical protein